MKGMLTPPLTQSTTMILPNSHSLQHIQQHKHWNFVIDQNDNFNFGIKPCFDRQCVLLNWLAVKKIFMSQDWQKSYKGVKAKVVRNHSLIVFVIDAGVLRVKL